MFSLGGNKRDSKIWTKKDKNLKIHLVLSGLIILLLLVGCSDAKSIDIVKQGTLNGFEQKTVGKAFDSFFRKTKWDSFEMENGMQIVEFTGKLPRDFTEEGITEYGWITSTKPKGGNFLMQFIVQDGAFEISYSEVTTVLSGAGLELVGANNQKFDIPMDDAAIFEWLNYIYQ